MMKKSAAYKVPVYITNEEVVKYVNKVVKALKEKGLYEEQDKLILDELAANYQILLEAYQQIQISGLTAKDRYGNTISSPYIAIKKNAEDVITKIIRDLGLSAKSRKALKSDSDDDFDLESMLND
jgi:P27 family predicted phage terminase small subunit